MNILITGANGFVGQVLCTTLLARGFNVRGAVRTKDSLPKKIPTIIINNIGTKTNWDDALKDIDVVIHLAAKVHEMKKSPDMLDEYRKVNTFGTEQLAKSAAKFGVKRIVFLSTIKVNGEETKEKPFTENDIPNPQDPYGISKWEAEQALKKIGNEQKIEIVILRTPLVYGPNVKANFLRLIKLVDKNIPIPLLNIKNNRSMIYIGNLADAIIACISNPKASGETFLLRDKEDISTSGLIKKIAFAKNKKPILLPCPIFLLKIVGTIIGKKDEIDRLTGSLCIDDTKIRNILGWVPPFSTDEGIKETIKWYYAKI
ncbi:SDR family oxidoreductase [Candidatus Poribacteria bacterium]|nr:SDR family oxidoreductase [Candidatus Poribacteria bacterium]